MWYLLCLYFIIKLQYGYMIRRTSTCVNSDSADVYIHNYVQSRIQNNCVIEILEKWIIWNRIFYNLFSNFQTLYPDNMNNYGAFLISRYWRVAWYCLKQESKQVWMVISFSCGMDDTPENWYPSFSRWQSSIVLRDTHHYHPLSWWSSPLLESWWSSCFWPFLLCR